MTRWLLWVFSRGGAKWEAWKAVEGLSKEEAQQKWAFFCGFFYQVYNHHLFNYIQIHWPDSITCGEARDRLASRTQQKTLSPHVHHLILIVSPSTIQTYIHYSYSFSSKNSNIYSTSFLYTSWIICIQHVDHSYSSACLIQKLKFRISSWFLW